MKTWEFVGISAATLVGALCILLSSDAPPGIALGVFLCVTAVVFALDTVIGALRGIAEETP